ncbi:Nucleotide-binding alpha-beta plait domain [Phytophthora cactorum]|nr:Nucleotide-binding alpha-beta plait domain [Phytophthora cactorum]
MTTAEPQKPVTELTVDAQADTTNQAPVSGFSAASTSLGGRVRKTTQTFTFTQAKSDEPEEFSPPVGKGVKVRDMEFVKNNVEALGKKQHDMIKQLYSIMLRPSVPAEERAHSGLLGIIEQDEKSRENLVAKMGKWKLVFVHEVMDLLAVDRSKKSFDEEGKPHNKEALLDRLVDWLHNPQVTKKSDNEDDDEDEKDEAVDKDEEQRAADKDEEQPEEEASAADKEDEAEALDADVCTKVRDIIAQGNAEELTVKKQDHGQEEQEQERAADRRGAGAAQLEPEVVEAVQEQVKTKTSPRCSTASPRALRSLAKRRQEDKKNKKKQANEDEHDMEKAVEQDDVADEEEPEADDGEKKKKKKKKSKKKKTEDDEEVEEEKELTPDDLKARRTVFVGNVSLDATQKDLKNHFSVCGKVETKILTTAKDNCNAYVSFVEESSVEAALKLNGTTLVQKKIRVDRSDPVIDARRTPQVEEEPEPIENVRLIRDRESGLGKGFGYLLLRSPALVAKTLALRDLKMETRELRVQVCGKRFKNLRGEETVKEKFEGLRASAGARARIHLKRKVGAEDLDRGLATKKMKRAAAAAGLGKKLKPKHAARKAAKAAAEAAAAAKGRTQRSASMITVPARR